VLQGYLPVIVFVGLGLVVGLSLITLNHLLGPKRPSKVKSEPYECGLPTEVSRTFRFGVSFYMVAMLFILFPVGVILQDADSFFVLAEILVFVGLLLVALIYVWRRGALDWR
jgi:NADH-quinone oxidoreductase subunit A